jgi:kumamolisin
MTTQRINLPGSGKKPIKKGQYIESPLSSANEQIEVTISIRRKHEIPAAVAHAGQMTREQLAAQHGATAIDFARVAGFALEHKLRIVEENVAARTLKIAGAMGNMEEAFGTKLRHVKVSNAVYRERTGPLSIPAELDGIIEGVFGLDNRPTARPHFQIARRQAQAYSPLDVARLYNFPPGNGEGQIIALIELGGGYNKHDLNSYFAAVGVTPPDVAAISVAGSSNQPTGDPKGPDGEVMLDIEVAGAIAPAAKIKVYFAPNTDKGFLDAINEAIHGPETPTVVSISWGGPEASWTAQARNAINQAFQNAAALGIPVTVASGDNGSTDGTNALAVDFPASAPYALSCGGSSLRASSGVTAEAAWNSNGGATGGGVSVCFPRPVYQLQANMPGGAGSGRGVPDVCGNADPQTGYKIRVDGTDAVSGGTSAVAPLWAALIARLSQNLGHRVPFLNPVLYADPSVFRDITFGNNEVGNGAGLYKATIGWDACTGLGSPNGIALLKVLQSKDQLNLAHSSILKPIVGALNTNEPQRPFPEVLPSPVKPNPVNLSPRHFAPVSGETGTTGLTSGAGNTGFTNTGFTGSTGQHLGTGTGGTGNTGHANHHMDKNAPKHPVSNAAQQKHHRSDDEKMNQPSNGCASIDIHCKHSCHCDAALVAIVGIVANVTNTAITAITAIAAGDKKGS